MPSGFIISLRGLDGLVGEAYVSLASQEEVGGGLGLEKDLVGAWY